MDFVVHPEKESQSARDEDEEVVVEKKKPLLRRCFYSLVCRCSSVSLLFPSLALVNKPSESPRQKIDWLPSPFHPLLSSTQLLRGSSATMNISISKGSGLRQ